MRKIGYFLTVLFTLCLIFALFSCSCSDENTDTPPTQNSTPQGGSSTQNSTTNSTPSFPEPPLSDVVCSHYWKDVTVDTNTEATSTVIMKGTCYLCGDSLYEEHISTVTYEEWKKALSPDYINSFTVFVGNTYTDYGEKNSMSWKISNNIHTESYYINLGKNAASYLTEYYSGYITASMFNQFTYNREKRAYVYEINENSHIELCFANGYLISHSEVSTSEGKEKKSTTLYLNHNNINVNLPQYFYDHFKKITAENNIDSSALPSSHKEAIKKIIKGLDLNGKIEVAYLENGGLSVYFYLDREVINEVLNENYSSVTLVAKDDILESIIIGKSTFSLK